MNGLWKATEILGYQEPNLDFRVLMLLCGGRYCLREWKCRLLICSVAADAPFWKDRIVYVVANEFAEIMCKFKNRK
jgi:hypothetical protein